MQKDVILTPEGLEKLKQEIEYLSTTKRREVAERIKEAREFGDISENSEYDDAKNEQMMLEQKIAQLEERLRSAQVVNTSELSTDLVRVVHNGIPGDCAAGEASCADVKLTARLYATTHQPKVGNWPIKVTATRGSQKLSGTVNYRFL